jgi:hypothetical protein
MDLADFLLARIAEDEAVAREAQRNMDSVPAGATIFHRADLEHIARWDPARVLVKCKADRRIVEECTWVREERFQVRPGVYEYRPVREPRYGDGPEWDILRLLAVPYADHPDYCEVWRP